MATPLEISVEKLNDLRTAGDTLTLVDVRDGWELDICAIDGSVHIPLNQLPQRVAEVPTDRTVVVVCHHGARSAQAMMFLRQKGLTNVTNLEGGVDAWARRIDPAMKVY
jgi:rhodanese-related sulfurtransferase